MRNLEKKEQLEFMKHEVKGCRAELYRNKSSALYAVLEKVFYYYKAYAV